MVLGGWDQYSKRMDAWASAWALAMPHPVAALHTLSTKIQPALSVLLHFDLFLCSLQVGSIFINLGTVGRACLHSRDSYGRMSAHAEML